WSLLLCLLLTACRREAERWNVLLVVVDTLRADRMSLYGYRRPTTPNLDALAREGMVFSNARSQAGCTFPSANSLLTSRQPAVFLPQGGAARFVIPPAARSLPEILRQHGYFTAAVSASPIVRHTPSRENPAGGYGRGFQVFDESCFWKHGDCMNERALGLLEAFREPWFFYLHYMEPHAPYRPPRGHLRRFAATPGRARELGVHPWARRGDSWPIAQRLYNGDPRLDFNPQDLAHLSDLYDEEILYLDEQLAKLFDALRTRHLRERTLIVLAADHGEELYDHGQYNHCRNLAYETLFRTPLAMWIPGVEPGLRRQAIAENLDIVPTILDYLRIPAERLALDGASLRPTIEGDRPVRRLSFGLQGLKRTVLDGTRKLTFDLGSGQAQLFDIEADPGEKSDLSARFPEETLRLKTALLRWTESHEGPLASGESRRRATELEKRLRALGYL
ncbi:MAG TPA: sulfatase, partial [Thermoanaerobaculia bacterium]|nr:sulfatase [Thermoanaerobaculia bacterium]